MKLERLADSVEELHSGAKSAAYWHIHVIYIIFIF
jgi:hypothetical protein